MKKLSIISLLLIVVISSCKRSGISDVADILTSYKFFTFHDNTLFVQISDRKDSILLISIATEMEKAPLEYIDVEYFYGEEKIASISFSKGGTIGQTMVVGDNSYDYVHPSKPRKDYIVNIYTRSDINGNLRKILLGEVKFLNPQNGVFEQIVMMERVGTPALGNK